MARIGDIKKEQVKKGNKADLLFWGQACEGKLLPKLGRVLPRGKNTGIETLEKLLFAGFKDGSLPVREFEPEDDWDHLALAQHHGLPTRLLDWTFGAPAALWFAVRHPPQERDHDGTKYKNGVVWVLAAPTEDFRLDRRKDCPFDDNPRAQIFRPRAISRRIVAQSAVFTIHQLDRSKKFVPLEQDPRYSTKWRSSRFRTWLSQSIRQELHMLSANAKLLFPDLDGLCCHLSWRHTKLEDEN